MTFHTSSFLTHMFTDFDFNGDTARLEPRDYHVNFGDTHAVLFLKDGFAFCYDDADCLYCFPIAKDALSKSYITVRNCGESKVVKRLTDPDGNYIVLTKSGKEFFETSDWMLATARAVEANKAI